ncbi:MAG TPA: PAS domain-containing protein [Bacteroidales bacterium]|nr:PAS domain-containing protein [Bacteroidales bacterium]
MITDYFKDINIAVTICSEDGTIVYMNEKSAATFRKQGGMDLIGKNILDCHPEPARSRLGKMLITHETNSYTIEKNGVKKLIYQVPRFEDNVFKGYMELSLEIPFEMPHFVRK